jgi:hypothetical protein
MFYKRRGEPSNGTSSFDIFGTSRKASDKGLATVVRNNTIEEGISAFTLWLGVNVKDPRSMPIIMKQFRSCANNSNNNKAVTVSLQDNILQKDIGVDIVDGIPFCNGCRSNDCAHVGFAVCAEQMNLRSKLE